MLIHLQKNLGASHIVVGHDFAFGHKRSGNINMLKEFGVKLNFRVSVVSPQMNKSGSLFSSRAIRELLKSGNPRDAAIALGRWWTVEGVVEHGEKRGRKLGYPTININLGEYLEPSLGIYAVWVRIKNTDKWLKGAASLGFRPTFEGASVLLEVHLLNFEGVLYGKHVEVAFMEYLRPEEKFINIDSLKMQMANDCDDSLKLLDSKDYSIDYFD